jgi:hypothetical protein
VISIADRREASITLQDISSEWRKSCGSTKHLLIIIEGHYSGKWVDSLQASNGKISIMASCKASQASSDTGDGGDFTAYLINKGNGSTDPKLLLSCPTYTNDIERYLETNDPVCIPDNSCVCTSDFGCSYCLYMHACSVIVIYISH